MCCEYYSINSAKKHYKQLKESCSRSAAYALYNMPVNDYLTTGKTPQYEEQLSTLISICKHFGLKYLYVYVPDFKKNELTTIFYVNGKTDSNLKGRELGTKISWQITELEKATFNGAVSDKVYIADNYMGHTISSYAAVYSKNDIPIALVGADVDFNLVRDKIISNIFVTVTFISICLILIYTVLMLVLQRMFIKPVKKISMRMNNFAFDNDSKFKPLKVKSNDEIGLMAKSSNKMVNDINHYIEQITETQMETIFSLAKLAQSRDDDTGKHLERVQQYCRLLAEELQKTPKYAKSIDDNYIENLVNASTLHDIGKVGISDSILLKDGKLTEEEYNEIKKHTVIGYETLRDAHSKFGTNSFIEMGMVVALYHHERWDGKGYPYGIKGEDIPLAARIMAIADVYDALSTKRSYKPAFDKEKCEKIIIEEKGAMFDPDLVDAFVNIKDKFYEVRRDKED